MHVHPAVNGNARPIFGKFKCIRCHFSIAFVFGKHGSRGKLRWNRLGWLAVFGGIPCEALRGMPVLAVFLALHGEGPHLPRRAAFPGRAPTFICRVVVVSRYWFPRWEGLQLACRPANFSLWISRWFPKRVLGSDGKDAVVPQNEAFRKNFCECITDDLWENKMSGNFDKKGLKIAREVPVL